jgi:hypothetical protein
MQKPNANSTEEAPNLQLLTIHPSLQGKGGVGKSLVASILAQYHLQRGKTVRCIDTNPSHATPPWMPLDRDE